MLHKLLNELDSFYITLCGLAVDLEYLTPAGRCRPPFSSDGLIRRNLGYLPGVNTKLKEVADKFGGWERITSPEYDPPDALYRDFEAVGFTEEQFRKTRTFLKDELAYAIRAVKKLDN